MMPEKVLLIHGIAMRSEEKVAGYAASLNALIGDEYELVPVYWGDLGADDTYLHKVIGRHRTSADGFSDMVHEAVARPLSRGKGRVRAWIERRKGDRERSAVILRASQKRSTDARQRVHGYLGDKFQDARLWLTQQSLPFIADVIVYQSHTYREKIQARVREVIKRELGEQAGTADQPVKVVAHSLGGVVSFDLACRNQDALHIDALVTLGSQPAFFHLLDPREGVADFEGEPVAVPETIGRWTNVWDEYDMLGFATDEVFRLYDGTAPLDVRVRATRSRVKGGLMLRSHLRYFTNKETAEAIKLTLDTSNEPEQA
jgi:pimeloyl-ACP methyl ester carboxylesterase